MPERNRLSTVPKDVHHCWSSSGRSVLLQGGADTLAVVVQVAWQKYYICGLACVPRLPCIPEGEGEADPALEGLCDVHNARPVVCAPNDQRLVVTLLPQSHCVISHPLDWNISCRTDG